MELLVEYSSELLKLIVVGGVLGLGAVIALAAGVDSGKFDSEETRIFIKEEQFKTKG